MFQKSLNAEAVWQLLKTAIDRLNVQSALLQMPSRKKAFGVFGSFVLNGWIDRDWQYLSLAWAREERTHGFREGGWKDRARTHCSC